MVTIDLLDAPSRRVLAVEDHGIGKAIAHVLDASGYEAHHIAGESNRVGFTRSRPAGLNALSQRSPPRAEWGPGPARWSPTCWAASTSPTGGVAETMADLFGLDISTGTIDSIYSEAGRRLRGFIAALVALLRSLPVLHADETTDRIGTKNCSMHVVSTGLYTLIHASVTRGGQAIDEAGVLRGYRGVIIHDRLAMYWKLKRAKHGLCAAHLLRDLADVALVATQTAWAAGVAALLVEINAACDDARLRGLKQLAPNRQRRFAARYDTLVADGVAANPEPPNGHKRDYLQRRSFNLVTAFATHRRSILRYMYDLDVAFTNNQGERDLRPTKLHRKISGGFRTKAGAERFAHLRSYLSTTRKNDVSAMDALTRLFNDDPLDATHHNRPEHLVS